VHGIVPKDLKGMPTRVAERCFSHLPGAFGSAGYF